MEYSQDDNLLIQSYFTTALLVELKNNDFLNSESYKSLKFNDNYVKENLPLIGIDNQGTFLMIFYTMLVIPKQHISENFPNEFNELNRKAGSLILASESSYETDKNEIDYIRHIRNAVAHARVLFIPGQSVTFIDENSKGERCTITFPLCNIHIFLTCLQSVFMKYIEKLKSK
jgi:hypothetical protein